MSPSATQERPDPYAHASLHLVPFTMQDLINQVNKRAHAVKSKVESLDEDNAAAKKKKGAGEGTAAERTRTTITAGLKKKLKDTMGEFSDLRSKIQEEYREVVERRVYTVTGAHSRHARVWEYSLRWAEMHACMHAGCMWHPCIQQHP